jgi:integrase
MIKKRPHGDGGIEPRGENCWRLRYRLNGRRFTVTFHGTKSEGLRELRRLIKSGEDGEHIAPDRITLAQWLPRWTALIERKADDDTGAGRNRGRLVNSRTLERYEELLRLHVLPTLGPTALQKIRGTQIDDLYIALERRLAPRTVHHVHTVLCLNVAVRKGLIASNPAANAEAPSRARQAAVDHVRARL